MPGRYTLPELPYPYDALEPYIDEPTMRLHHDKHHAAYVNNLNAALDKHPEFAAPDDVTELLRRIQEVPEDIRTAVRNHGGGHANHTLFWEIMRPGGAKEPHGPLAEAIARAFGDVPTFRQRFSEAAVGLFGSGWAWLVVDGQGQLQLRTTPNQDSPYMDHQTPILGLDVWEHAYYLKYRNRRPDYIDAWWNVVNWKKVAEDFARVAR